MQATLKALESTDLIQSDQEYIYLTIEVLRMIYCVVKAIYKWI